MARLVRTGLEVSRGELAGAWGQSLAPLQPLSASDRAAPPSHGPVNHRAWGAVGSRIGPARTPRSSAARPRTTGASSPQRVARAHGHARTGTRAPFEQGWAAVRAPAPAPARGEGLSPKPFGAPRPLRRTRGCATMGDARSATSRGGPVQQASRPVPGPTPPTPIAHTHLGRTGLDVSRLGLAGSFGISAEDTERAFHELGVNYFFLTPRMKGVSEGVRRLVRAGHRDRIAIATGANIPMGWTVRRAWEKIARSLGVDRLDVFHLFWVQGRWYVTGKTWPAMRALKDEDKVAALAVSCHDRPFARRLADDLDLDVLMIRYNAAHRGAEEEVFATLGEPRPGIVSYTATRWGRLLKPVGDLGPMTAPECYRFALGHPAVDVTLCGARSFAELAENVHGVALGPLDETRLAEVRRFGDAVRATARGRIGFRGR